MDNHSNKVAKIAHFNLPFSIAPRMHHFGDISTLMIRKLFPLVKIIKKDM